jgi:hypothetical protein
VLAATLPPTRIDVKLFSKSIPNLKRRDIIMTIYAPGLPVSEVLPLRVIEPSTRQQQSMKGFLPVQHIEMKIRASPSRRTGCARTLPAFACQASSFERHAGGVT